MATIAELRVPAVDVALGTAFDRQPSLRCRVEQAIGRGFPNVWIAGPPRSDIERALEADPSIASFSLVIDGDDELLYDLGFSDDVADVATLVFDNCGTIISASAARGTWSLDVRFDDRDDASACYDDLSERGVSVDVVRLQDLTAVTSQQLGLTPEQYETLVAAVEHGYFEIPREVSMQDLADELGVSHQALSERLRRAYETLVTSELDVSPDSPSDSGPVGGD